MLTVASVSALIVAIGSPLGAMQSTDVDFLIARLADPETTKAQQAARALSEIGARAVQPLISALSSGSSDVRSWAAIVLGWIRDGRAIPALKETAVRDQHAEVRQHALGALRALGEVEDPATRQAAAQALRELGDKRVPGQSPGERFWSDELLERAAVEVRGLDRDQLETLIEYLATCHATVDSKEREFACERTTLKLEIKVHLAQSLRRLIFAMGVQDRIVHLSWNRADREEKDRLSKSIQRRVDIASRLRTAASERYTQLSPASRQP